MPSFTKAIVVALIGSAVVLPYWASTSGLGMKSERNAAVLNEAKKSSARSYFYGHRSYGRNRSVLGGGPRHGK